MYIIRLRLCFSIVLQDKALNIPATIIRPGKDMPLLYDTTFSWTKKFFESQNETQLFENLQPNPAGYTLVDDEYVSNRMQNFTTYSH